MTRTQSKKHCRELGWALIQVGVELKHIAYVKYLAEPHRTKPPIAAMMLAIAGGLR